ncbi:MAG: DEAD/DEAH box helicase, partial [Gammaproteobacteria bacterium]
MTLTLHPHQVRAVAAGIASLRAGHTPVLSVATGGGKSLIAADLAYRGHGRVLVTAHRKELVAGNAAEMLELHPDADVGIYSAGVGRRDTSNKVVFAGIDSVVNRMADLQAGGPFSAVIVDEAHRIPLKNKPSRYRTLLEACPGAKLIGMTATPYRLDGGLLYDGPDTWFDDLAIDVGIRELTDAVLLTPLIGVRGDVEPNLKGVAKSVGDWSPGELSERMMEDEVVQDAMAEIMALAKDRESWLIFCVDVKHVELVAKELQMRGVDARLVTGKTPKDERDALINGFKNREFRALVNCEILTTGSNLPCADCGILLRPTESKG